MRFYRASKFLFPRSLQMRLFAVCFIGTHVPLIAFLLWQIARGQIAWADTGLLLIATLFGTAGALLGIRALLAPLRMSIEGVASIERGEPFGVATAVGPDEMGQLLARVSEAAAAVQSRLSALDQAAHRDPLTGLLNRRGFFLEADPLFHAHVGGAFALIDLDRFKLINDTYGHPTGDRVIRDFCNRLRATVGRDDVVARWGGEEFAVYFPRADEAHARGILHQLARSIRDRPIAELGSHAATFSAGLVEVGDEPVDRTIERADAALYAAKRSGRAQVLVERDLLARAVGGLA